FLRTPQVLGRCCDPSVRPGRLPLPCPHPFLSETTSCLLVLMAALAHACSCPALEGRLGPIVPGQFFHARAQRRHRPARGGRAVLTRKAAIEPFFSILYIRSEPVICAGLRRFEAPARP